MKNKLFFIIFVVFLCFATSGATQHFVTVSGGQYEGAEVLVNYNWATGDATGWDGATGDITYNSPGITLGDAITNVYKLITYDTDKYYHVQIIVSAWTSGSFYCNWDATGLHDNWIEAAGTYDFTFHGSQAGADRIQIIAYEAQHSIGTIASVSVKPIIGG